MSVGVLIVTHGQIGQALLDAAVGVMGGVPMPVEILAVNMDADPDVLRSRAQAMLNTLDTGSGVLVLTDLYGSTPYNIARALSGQVHQVIVISGINLPMVVRMFNYSHLDLRSLADRVAEGGGAGIFVCLSEDEA